MDILVGLHVLTRILLAMGLAAIISYIATPFVKELAFKIGAVDVPKDNRRMHKVPIPRMGGLAIVIAFLLCTFLFVGMTVFLVISTVYPNGHYLRPHHFERDNIFTHMVGWLYSTDTATNLFPSIHVYNSLGVHFAIMHSEEFKQNKSVRIGSFVLMSSIILSTMFLKQHSVFDVITAFVMAAVMYTFVYGRSVVLEHQKAPEKSWHNI